MIPADKVKLLAETMSEKQLETHVSALARELGIFWLKIPDHAMKLLPPEWKGWPDYLFIGLNGLVWAELKSQNGRASREQIRFGMRLETAGVTYRLWRPSDLVDGTIRSVLSTIAL